MGRTTKIMWVEAGLELLRDGGQDALTIDQLCKRLSKTKGSFYHHFEHVEAYLDAVLDTWEERNTKLPIQAANRSATTKLRRVTLSRAVKRLDSRLDIAVRAWGLRDPRARGYVERVDEARIEYLAELTSPDLPRARRLLLGRLEYAAFLGSQQLDPTFSRADAKNLERLLYEALSHLER